VGIGLKHSSPILTKECWGTQLVPWPAWPRIQSRSDELLKTLPYVLALHDVYVKQTTGGVGGDWWNMGSEVRPWEQGEKSTGWAGTRVGQGGANVLGRGREILTAGRLTQRIILTKKDHERRGQKGSSIKAGSGERQKKGKNFKQRGKNRVNNRFFCLTL